MAALRSGRDLARTALWASFAAAGCAAAGYAAYVGATWLRYGHPDAPRTPSDADPLLDRFMPVYDVAERHQVRVGAPADVTLAIAKTADLQGSPLVRAIFRARELVLGAAPVQRRAVGLVEEMTALGWGVLADEPGRELVVGAVTQPWLADVAFRAVPPNEFASFREPGYVKIAWTLRADPDGPHASIFRTETRVTTTDAEARARFRWYWARFSAGIVLIRRVLLPAVKRGAERAAATPSGALTSR